MELQQCLLSRSSTLLLTLAGGALLCALIRRRGRGSWSEAAVVVGVQIVWQVSVIMSSVVSSSHIIISSKSLIFTFFAGPGLVWSSH